MSSWFLPSSGSTSPSQANNPNASSSQLRGGPAIQELLPHLYPQQSTSPAIDCGTSKSGGGGGLFWDYYGSSKRGGGGSSAKVSRFSTLLLEHGEQAIQDWAVVAYAAPWKAGLAANATNTSSVNHNAAGTMNSMNSNNSNNGTSTSSSNNTNTIQWAQSPQTPPVNASGQAIAVNHNQKYGKNSNVNATNASNAALGTPRNSNSRTSPLRHMSSSALGSASKAPIRSAADISKDEYPTVHMTNIMGRLFLCTRSLVFEPEDTSRGVIRCPWTRMGNGGILVPPPDNYSDNQNCIQIYTNRHIVMKVNNVLGPFESVHLATKFRFCFLHSSPQPMMDLAQRLYHATTSNSVHRSSSLGGNHHASTAEAELYAYQKEHNQITSSSSSQMTSSNLAATTNVFDMDNLVDVVREQLLLPPMAATILTPLQSQAGVLVISSAERLYFQPGHVDIGGMQDGSHAAVRWNFSDIIATARRYHGLRDSALEIYWKTSSSSSSSSSASLSSTRRGRKGSVGNLNNISCSTLIAFERRHDREQVLRLLPLTATCLTDRDFLTRVVQEWLEGKISNYDYLLALNSAAGRSFHDLSRYPVMPWVLSDYTSEELDLDNPKSYRDLSKPVGALSQERLEYFQQRLANMQDLEKDPFLYGTHYSAPAYVLYYLVRTMPEHMLCLQNGKFDAADRMFYSMSHCYQCCLTNHADVKELIPQFYSLDKFDMDFLRNARALSLGATQNGERVHDVLLPPWAKDSPRKFVHINRQALESEYCTQQLPAWIDLIFGVSSRGEAAKKANNLFHRMSYLGPRELADASQEERATAELQATEFGIVPDELFQEAHPLPFKYSQSDNEKPTVDMEAFLAPHVGRSSSVGEAREAWELLEPPAPSQHQLTSGGASSTTKTNPFTSDTPYEEHSAMEESTSQSLPLRGSGESYYGPNTNPFDAHDKQGINSQQSRPKPTIDTDHQSEHMQHQDQPPQKSATAHPKVRTAWDMKMMERRPVHSDAVSGCALLLVDEADSIAEDEQQQQIGSANKNKSLLVTTSLDGGLFVQKVSLNKPSPTTSQEQAGANSFSSTFTRFSYSSIMNRGPTASTSDSPSSSSASGSTHQSKLVEYRTHSARDPLASLVVAGDGATGHVAFAGGHDDVVLAYGINSACAVASVYSHRDAVTGLDLIPRPEGGSTSTLWLDNATHIMVSGSWDATVKVWSASVSTGETVAIHREPLAELFDADSSIVSVSACAVEGHGGVVIAAGCADGSFCVWNVHNDGVQIIVHKETPSRRGSGPCSAVQWVRAKDDDSTPERLHLFCSFSTGKVASYTLVDNSSRLLSAAAVSVGVAVLSMVYSEGFLLVGCSDGGLRLVPVMCRQGGPNNVVGFFFDSKPTMWKAVNNKAAPGICSISIAYTMAIDKSGGEPVRKRRTICCTGAEDGSVALFELKLAPPTNS